MKISILVPVFKAEKYIARCAESLFSQDYDNLEFVFVNDCTPDKSIFILEKLVKEKYPERQSQVKIINHKKNRGSAAARNTLLDNATGEFVCWVDADDWLEKSAIRIMAEKQLESCVDIVSGWSYQVLNEGVKPFLRPNYTSRDEMIDCMWEHSFNHVLWGRLIKKSLYEKANNRCEEGVNQGEDYWLMLPVIYYCKKIAVVEKYVYYYNRVNESAQCYNYEGKENIDKWKQDKKNHFKVVAFFSDKEDKYKNKANESAVIYLRNRMLYHYALCNEKELYKEIVEQIKSKYHDYYYAINFNNPVRRIFVTTFSFYGTYIRIKSYIWNRLVNIIKGNK